MSNKIVISGFNAFEQNDTLTFEFANPFGELLFKKGWFYEAIIFWFFI